MNSRFLNSATLAAAGVGAVLTICVMLALRDKPGRPPEPEYDLRTLFARKTPEPKTILASDLHALYFSSPATGDERYLGREITVQGIVMNVSQSKRGENQGKWIVSLQTDRSLHGGVVGCVYVIMKNKPDVAAKDRFTAKGICKGWEQGFEVVTVQATD